MSKTGNEILYNDAEEAVEKLANDMTVEIEETIANLTALIGRIEIWQDALRTEL